jgi:sugar lactone lactonase YvrE
MKRLLIGVILLAVVAGAYFYNDLYTKIANSKQSTGTPKLAHSVTTGKNPEAVLFDKERNQYFVSLLNFKVQTGGGGVAILDEKGAIKDLNWVEGLNQPKGMVISGDKLYVADLTEFVEIDIPTAKITNKYTAEGGIFLNDPALGPDGSVYVTDSLTDSLFRLAPDGTYGLWLKDERLLSPNGAVVLGEYIYVASWGTTVGTTVKSMLEAKKNGKLVRVKLADKSITVYENGPTGNLDGIEPDGKGNFYISDWVSGNIFLTTITGKTLAEYDMAKILGVESTKGLADIEYMEDTKQIWAPMMINGTVLVFSMKEARGSE